jgi:hypothetical protein
MSNFHQALLYPKNLRISSFFGDGGSSSLIQDDALVITHPNCVV